jgi:hypothetical protein
VALVIQLLAKKVPCNYRDPISVWGNLVITSKLEKCNCLKNHKWLYTAWSADRREVRTSYKISQNISDLIKLNAMKDNKDLDDAQRNNDKVDKCEVLSSEENR